MFGIYGATVGFTGVQRALPQNTPGVVGAHVLACWFKP